MLRLLVVTKELETAEHVMLMKRQTMIGALAKSLVWPGTPPHASPSCLVHAQYHHPHITWRIRVSRKQDEACLRGFDSRFPPSGVSVYLFGFVYYALVFIPFSGLVVPYRTTFSSYCRVLSTLVCRTFGQLFCRAARGGKQ